MLIGGARGAPLAPSSAARSFLGNFGNARVFLQRLAPRFELRAQAKEINPRNFRHARRRAKAIEEVEIRHRELISR